MREMTLFEAKVAEYMQRRYVRLVGSGTTALYVALRAIALRDGSGERPGEVILPDLICYNVLYAVSFAGFTPRYADVIPADFNADPESIRRHVSSSTRAVIAAHIFGYVADPLTLVPGIPVIEDAAQGLGGTTPSGRAVGTLSEIAITSFNPTKMIGGHGGAVASDDPALWEVIQAVNLDEMPAFVAAFGGHAQAYHNVQADWHMIIRPFNSRQDNIKQIEAGWRHLPENVARRNELASCLRAELDKIDGADFALPEILPGDAIWRYTFAASSVAYANWIAHRLQLAGLPGSRLYPSLSGIFAPGTSSVSETIAPRLINLWVDDPDDVLDNNYVRRVTNAVLSVFRRRDS